MASAAGDAASWERGTPCPHPGSLLGTRVPQAQPGSPDAQCMADQRQSQVQGGGQHAALARAGIGSLPTCPPTPRPPARKPLWGLQGPGESLQTQSWGVCCRALNPPSRFLVWGTSWWFCILEKKKKAQTVLKRCLQHQPRERVLTGKAEGSPPEWLVCRPGVVAQWIEATRSSVGLQGDRHRHGDRPQSQGL